MFRRPTHRPGLRRGRPCTQRAAHLGRSGPSILNVNERYMRRLVSERRIPYFKVGRLLRFSPADLDAFIEACRVEVPPVHPLLRTRAGPPVLKEPSWAR